MAGPGAFAADLFTVEGVKVDVTAENAIAARDQAFAQAQIDAFKALAVKMLPEGEAEAMAAPDPLLVSTMIQDYEITEEKLSAVRYIGTYTFRFRESAVRQHFASAGQQFNDIASRPILVLPFFQGEHQMVLWSPGNAWMPAWSRAGDLGGAAPLVVPLGDLEDVSDVGEDDALGYDVQRLSKILRRYDAGEAVIAIAVPDPNLAIITRDEDPASGSLTINLYRTDREVPEQVRQLTVTAEPGQNRAQFYDIAVKRVHSALQSDWKQKTMAQQSTAKSMFQARVPIRNFNEWSETQKALQRVYGVNEVILRSLSPRNARVDLVYQGTEEKLKLALEQAGIALTDPGYAPTSYDGGPVMPRVYDLYLQRFAPDYSGRF